MLLTGGWDGAIVLFRIAGIIKLSEEATEVFAVEDGDEDNETQKGYENGREPGLS